MIKILKALSVQPVGLVVETHLRHSRSCHTTNFGMSEYFGLAMATMISLYVV
ncbi:hypothetical protein AVDCRST_MAG84-4572 [uncultured Microcoleus sp.]|uniref:Uncharacterized protein n=1 Tax=uncultured Microcoleus sp. TaxID=259945 RepID=A0A6J4N0E9_9CYAN|nr:hypothetical protein AVDCRST_MAG84-4572 [uncultured Microcoleus sp.]